MEFTEQFVSGILTFYKKSLSFNVQPIVTLARTQVLRRKKIACSQTGWEKSVCAQQVGKGRQPHMVGTVEP
jgi:hypothetical protein